MQLTLEHIEQRQGAQRLLYPLHLSLVPRAVTVLLGLGGPARAEAHRDATVATLAAMPLDAKDLVYLSPLRGSMPPDALAAEDRLLRAALVGRTRARATPYPAEAFVART